MPRVWSAPRARVGGDPWDDTDFLLAEIRRWKQIAATTAGAASTKPASTP